MFAIVGSIIAWITRAGWIAAALMVGLKLLFISFGAIVLPLVLKYVYVWIMEQGLSIANSVTGGTEVQPFVLQLTGLAAWLATRLQFQEMFSIIISAMIIKFSLRLMKI